MLHRKYLTVRREKEAQDRRDAIVAERETKATEERDRHDASDARGTGDRPPTSRSTARAEWLPAAEGQAAGAERSPMEMERGGGCCSQSFENDDQVRQN